MADEEQLGIPTKRGSRPRTPGDTRMGGMTPKHSMRGNRSHYVRGALMKHNTSGSGSSMMHVT